MVIVCSLKVILTYKSWEFRIETFWEWITEHIELITIINLQWKAFPIQNHQRYNGSQQDSGEMTLFIHCLTFLHEVFWYFDLRVFWNWNKKNLHQNLKKWGIRSFPKEINISPKVQSLHEQEYAKKIGNVERKCCNRISTSCPIKHLQIRIH